MRLHIISPLRRTIAIKRVRDGNLLRQYRSQSRELLPSPFPIHVRSVRHVCGLCRRQRTPPLPHFPRNAMKRKSLGSHLSILPIETKDLSAPVFASFQKQSTYSDYRGSASRSRNLFPNSPGHTNSGFALVWFRSGFDRFSWIIASSAKNRRKKAIPHGMAFLQKPIQ